MSSRRTNLRSVPFVFMLCAILLPVAACKQPVASPTGGTEATEYLGTKLTPIADQRNNALKGTQYIDRDTYKLTVDGLVENPLQLSYQDLLALPAESRLVTLNCVAGWSFVAKWTGPTLASIFDKAKLKPDVKTIIFRTTDYTAGFTSLDLQYVLDKNIIIALKLNDITLPADRGFPFQVVAEGKFGYKWAKWVERIELSDQEFKGYWESVGYNNNADINGPPYATP